MEHWSPAYNSQDLSQSTADADIGGTSTTMPGFAIRAPRADSGYGSTGYPYATDLGEPSLREVGSQNVYTRTPPPFFHFDRSWQPMCESPRPIGDIAMSFNVTTCRVKEPSQHMSPPQYSGMALESGSSYKSPKRKQIEPKYECDFSSPSHKKGCCKSYFNKEALERHRRKCKFRPRTGESRPDPKTYQKHMESLRNRFKKDIVKKRSFRWTGGQVDDVDDMEPSQESEANKRSLPFREHGCGNYGNVSRRPNSLQGSFATTGNEIQSLEPDASDNNNSLASLAHRAVHGRREGPILDENSTSSQLQSLLARLIESGASENSHGIRCARKSENNVEANPATNIIDQTTIHQQSIRTTQQPRKASSQSHKASLSTNASGVSLATDQHGSNAKSRVSEPSLPSPIDLLAKTDGLSSSARDPFTPTISQPDNLSVLSVQLSISAEPIILASNINSDRCEHLNDSVIIVADAERLPSFDTASSNALSRLAEDFETATTNTSTYDDADDDDDYDDSASVMSDWSAFSMELNAADETRAAEMRAESYLHGFRENVVDCWEQSCGDLLNNFTENSPQDVDGYGNSNVAGSNHEAPGQISISKSSTRNNTSSKRRSNGPSKRKLPDNEDDSEDEQPGKGQPSAPNDKPSPGPFPCPFWLNNPSPLCPYIRKSCRSSYEDIPHLKEHIIRAHLLPIHCRRCKKTFPSELEANSHATEPCEFVNKIVHGLTQKQEAQIRRRTKARSEPTAVWDSIHRIIFPDLPVREPIYEAAAGEVALLEGVKQDLIEKWPSMQIKVESFLRQPHIPQYQQDNAGQLIVLIKDLFCRAIDSVYTKYRSSLSTSSQSTPSIRRSSSKAHWLAPPVEPLAHQASPPASKSGPNISYNLSTPSRQSLGSPGQFRIPGARQQVHSVASSAPSMLYGTQSDTSNDIMPRTPYNGTLFTEMLPGPPIKDLIFGSEAAGTNAFHSGHAAAYIEDEDVPLQLLGQQFPTEPTLGYLGPNFFHPSNAGNLGNFSGPVPANYTTPGAAPPTVDFELPQRPPQQWEPRYLNQESKRSGGVFAGSMNGQPLDFSDPSFAPGSV